MIPAGESILTLPERVVMFLLLCTVATMALRTYYRRYLLILQGRSCSSAEEKKQEWLVRMLIYVPGQWSNIRTISPKDLGGAMHLILFWSAICFACYYFFFLILGEALGVFHTAFESPLALGFLSVVEIMAVLVLIALTWGLVRRVSTKPTRLGPDYEEGLFLFITLAGYLLFACFFCLGALRYNLGMTSFNGPVTGMIAGFLESIVGGTDGQSVLFHLVWWIQVAVILCFMIYVPYSDHQHAVFAPFNIFNTKSQPKGRLSKLRMDKSYHGLTKLENFTWKQLLELYGCAQCGRCQDACPAYAAGKDLSPKKIIQDLRIWMDETGKIKPFWKKIHNDGPAKTPDAARRISDAELWSCTSCMACVEACPAFVSSLDKIVDVRRDRVLAKSEFYPEVANLFRDLENFGDIFGKGKASREDWALGHKLKVLSKDNQTDVLFWVGCQTTFDDRSKSNAIKLAEILTHCGVDLAILGKNETCCGDPFRRLGNEFQYQNFARKNIGTLNNLRFKRIVTYCPHCYNTLKNEYAQFDGTFEVIHYTELFEELLAAGKLKLNRNSRAKVVYHDPCYLARGNDLTKGHEVLEALPGFVSLPLEKSGVKTFCCGGGGGAMWMRESGGNKINDLRVQQLVQESPDIIATSCPYCIVMLDDAISSLGLEQVKCKDLIELVSETM